MHDGVGGAVSRCFCGARGADRALVVIRIACGLYGAGSVLNVCTLLFMCAVECSCRRHDAGRRVCRAESGGGASGSFGQRINTTWLSRAKYGRRVAWSVWLVLLWVSHCCLLVCLFVLFAFRVLMVIVAIVAIAFGAYGAGTLRSTRERPGRFSIRQAAIIDQCAGHQQQFSLCYASAIDAWRVAHRCGAHSRPSANL